MQSLKKIHAWAQMQDPLSNTFLYTGLEITKKSEKHIGKTMIRLPSEIV